VLVSLPYVELGSRLSSGGAGYFNGFGSRDRPHAHQALHLLGSTGALHPAAETPIGTADQAASGRARQSGLGMPATVNFMPDATGQTDRATFGGAAVSARGFPSGGRRQRPWLDAEAGEGQSRRRMCPPAAASLWPRNHGCASQASARDLSRCTLIWQHFWQRTSPVLEPGARLASGFVQRMYIIP
jgi:hypothetical protein